MYVEILEQIATNFVAGITTGMWDVIVLKRHDIKLSGNILVSGTLTVFTKSEK